METTIHLKVHHQSPALNHAAKVFFTDICGFPLEISSTLNESGNVISIDYDTNNADNPLYIRQKAFFNLQEDLNPTAMVDIDGVTFPFACGDNSIMPFDPIALTWFLMFLPHEQLEKCSFDQHHRPKCHSSWMIANQKQMAPVIDIAAALFISNIRKLFPDVELPKRPIFIEPTFDIDIAFAHKSKSLIVHGLGAASLVMNGKFNTLKTRLNVWRNKEIDPYDVFDEILEVLEEQQLRAVFFAMTANRGKYDKNNNHKKPDYQKLIKKLDQKHIVGLHPGYASADNPRLVTEEKERLEDIVGHEIIHVRQHFLRQFLPDTWKTYINCGLKHDYSIGYANQGGYKVGTCTPYQAFDAITQKSLPLTLHPFAIMDTALWHHQNYNRNQVIEISNLLKSNQEQYHSSLSAVWHNYAMPQQSEELEVFKHQLSIFANHD